MQSLFITQSDHNTGSVGRKGALCLPKFRPARVVRLPVHNAWVRVIRPLSGEVRVTFGSEVFDLGVGHALLLARPGEALCAHQEATKWVTLDIRRSDLQIAMSHISDEPRRLIDCVVEFDWPMDEAVDRVSKDALVLVQALWGAGLRDKLFLVSGSVVRAMGKVRSRPEENWTTKALAAAAGVSVATLGRNFKACFGRPIGHVLRERRLDWIRERLAHPLELRSISQLARDAGFSSPSALARAYQAKFGESPTQTRARSFREAV